MSTDLLEPRSSLLPEKRTPWEEGELISVHRGHSRLALLNRSRPPRKKRLIRLPSTESLLTGGGDSRIVCGPDGRNRYGCSVLPELGVLAFGSSTASTISPAAFAAAEAVRHCLTKISEHEAPAVYEREMDRVRFELKDLCGLQALPGLEIIFGASGTDLHLFASQLMQETELGLPLIIRAEAAETGRGVPDALAGRHFGDCTPLGDAVLLDEAVQGSRCPEILEIKCRTLEGDPRSLVEIDAEIEAAVVRAVRARRRVLLTLVDVSKTGLLVPSPACVQALRRSFPESVDVLVDACQFRLAPETIRAYLENDFLVAVTGSKFITGPTFCGALLVPAGAALRLRRQPLPPGLASYCARADWPRGWAARSTLKPATNFGLLLRWEAALSELRAFRALPAEKVADFLATFADAIATHLATHTSFESLPGPPLDRSHLISATAWDGLPTIFPFLLTRKSADGALTYLSATETKRVHEMLREDLSGLPEAPSSPLLAFRCQVGQPVACGTRGGVAVSALRLCASSRLIVDALSPDGRGVEAVLADASAVLDKAALLAALPLT